MTEAGERTIRQLARASLDAAKAQDRDAWLAVFADDAVIQDPVGPSPFDPTGKGHRGKEAMGACWDNVIARNLAFDYKIQHSHLCGDELAAAAEFVIRTPEDELWEMELVIVYTKAADGRIGSLRAFWEFPGDEQAG